MNSNYDDPTKISTFTRKFDNHGSGSILYTSPHDRYLSMTVLKNL